MTAWRVPALPSFPRPLPSRACGPHRGRIDRAAKELPAHAAKESGAIPSQSPLMRLFRLLLLCDEGLIHALHHHVAAEDALRRHVPVQLRLQETEGRRETTQIYETATRRKRYQRTRPRVCRSIRRHHKRPEKHVEHTHKQEIAKIKRIQEGE